MNTESLPRRIGITRHDLRNPLGEAMGFAEILIEEAAEQELTSLIPALQQIHDSATDTLEDLNRQLTSENLRARPELVEELTSTIAAFAVNVTDSVNRLERECGTIKGCNFSEDLCRIRDAVIRLAERAPALLCDLLRTGDPADAANEYAETVMLTRDGVKAADSHHPTGETVFLHRAASDSGPGAAGATILVVDDTEANRALLTRRLTRQGFNVAVAEDGSRALELLHRQPFDLVLLDIMMPEMDGHHVLLEIKTDPGLRHLPVIMISGLDDLDNLVRCIENGAEDYLTKPFDPVLLRARIGASLEKKRLRDRELDHLREIDQQRRRADELLHVILPPAIAAELKEHDRVQPRLHPDVAVLFADVTGFTDYCGKNPQETVIANLQDLVARFEEISERHGLEKIKTIGDAYMATAGLLQPVKNPALNASRAPLEMCAAARKLDCGWRVHVGIHVGPVVAGVVGARKYHFDIWGDTVNTASRVADLAGEEGVLLSESSHARIEDLCHCEYAGHFEARGKGKMRVFRVLKFPAKSAK
ncbi:MAG: response regulator [Verrucomicrobiae bacterium]|nr:response regulator [Verrucomicrobiae bacterium]